MPKNNGENPPPYATGKEERRFRKIRLAGAFRLFAKYGFDEGTTGHITARDPEYPNRFWINPRGMHFSQIKASDLICVNHDGDIVEGNGVLHRAGFAIHSGVYKARPDVAAVAHAHSIYGKTWSTLGRLLDPITQDACQFYKDHALFVLKGSILKEGKRIGEALGKKKALIMQNHGLLTVGQTVDSAVWWFIAMERLCQSQLLAESVGKPTLLPPHLAESLKKSTGSEKKGFRSFQPLWDLIVKDQPDLLK
ncbi:class II aldolase/adducin family protein [Ammoniphilus sp. 3BR4]|uniref:class II aldolase/adducin family protein n=1 Tax=Ammoniphilus sp. 3BR4 TaxID=3158265 RepID=UPI0034657B87